MSVLWLNHFFQASHQLTWENWTFLDVLEVVEGEVDTALHGDKEYWGKHGQNLNQTLGFLALEVFKNGLLNIGNKFNVSFDPEALGQEFSCR